MAGPKIEIPIECVSKLAVQLQQLATSAQEVAEKCKRANLDFVKTDGWQTMSSGVQIVVEQLLKFAGPDSLAHKVNAADILLPGQTVPKTKSTRAKKQSDLVATTKAARSAKTKPNGNDNKK